MVPWSSGYKTSLNHQPSMSLTVDCYLELALLGCGDSTDVRCLVMDHGQTSLLSSHLSNRHFFQKSCGSFRCRCAKSCWHTLHINFNVYPDNRGLSVSSIFGTLHGQIMGINLWGCPILRRLTAFLFVFYLWLITLSVKWWSYNYLELAL